MNRIHTGSDLHYPIKAYWYPTGYRLCGHCSRSAVFTW